MSKKLRKKAVSEWVKWDPATGQLTFKIPTGGDYDANNEAAVGAAKARLGEIERLMCDTHSSSGLTNRDASLLAREKKQLESFIRSYIINT